MICLWIFFQINYFMPYILQKNKKNRYREENQELKEHSVTGEWGEHEGTEVI